MTHPSAFILPPSSFRLPPSKMSPYILLIFLIGGAYGAAFHIWQGKSAKELFYYLPAGIIGFVLGQIVASYFNWQLYQIGPLHIIEASIGAWSTLFIARWLKG
ncbi:MAG TPA: hypothetical protein ENK24_02895 [Anaerolineae bacterium]|nr:hypothetical protein [Anaerolineae bacterium]